MPPVLALRAPQPMPRPAYVCRLRAPLHNFSPGTFAYLFDDAGISYNAQLAYIFVTAALVPGRMYTIFPDAVPAQGATHQSSAEGFMVTNVERIASHLQGAAAIRRWTIENIPFTESAVGYDLFIRIGADSLAGLPLDFKSLRRDMPHPDKQIRQQLAKLVSAGLLVQQDGGFSGHAGQNGGGRAGANKHAGSREGQRSLGHEAGPIRLMPTPRFSALLNAYAMESDRVYAVRKNLREQQLLVTDADPDLHEFIDRVYDHFHDLGWMYLHNFGAVCFLMASLVCRVVRSQGYRARVMSGYVEIIRASDQYRFTLGGNAKVAPGQIPGHAFCIIEESLIIDFGLGNVRRAYHRDFPWALACGLLPRPVPSSPVVGGMVLANGDRISWKDDWQYPESAAELAKFEVFSEQLVERYHQAFGDESRRDSRRNAALDSGAMPLDMAPPPGTQARAALSATR